MIRWPAIVIRHLGELFLRILVVEDDEKIATFVVNGLKQNGFAVDHSSDGEAAIGYCETVSYDAIILDIMLPKLDGLSVLRRIRHSKQLIPVILLSAKASVDDRVAGLQSGADDYLTKPFAFSELLARLHALIRRANHTAEPTSLAVGDLAINLITREVTRATKLLELQSREFSLLELLMRNAGRPVTKTMILEHIWDYSFDPQTNVVDVLVHRLRSKIDRDFSTKVLSTVRGVGYVLRKI